MNRAAPTHAVPTTRHHSWCGDPRDDEPFCMSETLHGVTRAHPNRCDTATLEVTMSQSPDESIPEIAVTRDGRWCLSLTPGETAMLVSHLTRLLADGVYR